jgi:hypothetical protein
MMMVVATVHLFVVMSAPVPVMIAVITHGMHSMHLRNHPVGMACDYWRRWREYRSSGGEAQSDSNDSESTGG